MDKDSQQDAPPQNEAMAALQAEMLDFQRQIAAGERKAADTVKADTKAIWAEVRPHLLGALRSWVVLSNATFVVLAELIPLLQDAIPSLRQVMGHGQYAHFVAAVAIINIALRFKTQHALAEKVQSA